MNHKATRGDDTNSGAQAHKRTQKRNTVHKSSFGLSLKNKKFFSKEMTELIRNKKLLWTS
jgi:hypothetical protein